MDSKVEKILDIAKRRGFFWQNSLIHGAMAGFYDYAHLGTLLKRKWENVWRSFFLGLDDNFYEISVCTIMPEHVFKASGHLASFVDPVVRCRKCGNTERADHIIEESLKENFEGASLEKMNEIIKAHNIRCPKCNGVFEETGTLNMMFPLNVGTGAETRRGYLSPETAQGAYVNFRQEFECLRRRLPLGLAIIGRAYRNEISPRNVLIRMREFTQAELQIFFDPDAIKEHPRFEEVKEYKIRVFPVKNRNSGKIDEISADDVVKVVGLPKFYVYYMAKIQQFYLDLLKLPKDAFRFRQLTDEEKAFYNKYHWDVELKLESIGGFKEVAGIHYRTDHDLLGHQKVSGESQEVNINGKKFIPHVLELSFGVDRNIYALFEIALDEELAGKEKRMVMKFPRIVSPFDAGIFPLVNRDGLQEKAREVYNLLKDKGFQVFYDESGSIGRRYRRIDEIGVAAGITIDYDTLKNDDVTLRDRDSMKQVRIKISELPDALKRFLNGEELERLGALKH
ncbi:MAG: glycine--tRNA ligase [Candidatus Aenigmatarchaeota archaeon]